MFLGGQHKRERKEVINNKKLFSVSILLLFIMIVLNFPFPHHYPFGEVVLSFLHIPSRLAGGFHFIGIITMLLLIVGLVLLVRSVDKYRVRLLVVAIIIVFFIPPFVVSSFQQTLATGIYAVSYESEHSTCEFDMVDEKTLQGICVLPFQNYSNDDVTFTVEFYENHYFEEPPMMSLMNENAPHEVTLGGKEGRQIIIENEIDVSTMKNHIESGGAQGIELIIHSTDKKREFIF